MKICYCDESGTGGEPYALMAGVLVDSHRMHKTKEHWESLLLSLSRLIERPLEELHTKDFYPGNGVWRGLDGEKRGIVVDLILDWLIERSHKAIIVCVDVAAYETSKKINQVYPELSTLWRFMGMHLLLSTQKYNQAASGTKGHTLMVFDNEESEKAAFSDLVFSPPAWSDSYYSKKKKNDRLDVIVDVPYFADSKQVPLIQAADFLCYFCRKYVEIAEGKIPEKYPGEKAKLEGWMAKIRSISVKSNFIYPATGRCEVSELFYSHAPESFKTAIRG